MGAQLRTNLWAQQGSSSNTLAQQLASREKTPPDSNSKPGRPSKSDTILTPIAPEKTTTTWMWSTLGACSEPYAVAPSSRTQSATGLSTARGRSAATGRLKGRKRFLTLPTVHSFRRLSLTNQASRSRKILDQRHCYIFHSGAGPPTFEARIGQPV